MRKRVKKITEEIREYGVITMDHHLMDGLLKYACCESTTTADIDMTAAIMDRSSQGYSRFLDSRSQLIKLLESYAENDKKKTAIVNSIIGDVDKYLECDVSLANKLEKDAAGY